jgi:hypothetical protein
MAGYLLGAGSDPRAATAARPSGSTGRTAGQGPAAERASQTAEDQDATPASRRARAGAKPQRPEDGIVSEEIPRPPRGVPGVQSRRQAATAPAGESTENRNAAQARGRRTPAGPASAPAGEESLTATTASAAAGETPASASIDDMLSRAPSAAPETDLPVPPRTDDIPD